MEIYLFQYLYVCSYYPSVYLHVIISDNVQGILCTLKKVFSLTTIVTFFTIMCFWLPCHLLCIECFHVDPNRNQILKKLLGDTLSQIFYLKVEIGNWYSVKRLTFKLSFEITSYIIVNPYHNLLIYKSFIKSKLCSIRCVMSFSTYVVFIFAIYWYYLCV